MKPSNSRFLFVLALLVPALVLGNGNQTGSSLRTCDGAIMVAAGLWHTVALRSDGTVWTWGWNASGQLGDGTTTDRNIPVQVLGPGGTGFLTDVIAVAAGMNYTVALKSDGTVWTWGENEFGQLGNGTTIDSPVPVQVVGPGGTGFLTNVIAVAAKREHTVALRSDGTVWAWGLNNYGQLGDGTSTNSPTPVQVVGPDGSEFLSEIIAVAAGGNHTVALNYDCTVWTWGDNSQGQLGTGTPIWRSPTPVQVVGAGGSGIFTGVIAVAAGDWYTVALKSDGTVWSWGENRYGQLGDGTTIRRTTPVQVVGPEGGGILTNVIAIATGYDNHTVALRSDGTVWTWGDNYFGQLGDGTTTDRHTPVQVVGPEGDGVLSDIVAIAAGVQHTVAIKSDGTVWTWGRNNCGQLGDGTTEEYNPTPVQALLPLEGIFAQKVQSPQIRLFPNPASDFVEITAEPNCLFTLYDLSGKILKTQNISGHGRIPLKDLPHGVYLYKLTAPDGETGGKLLIVH